MLFPIKQVDTNLTYLNKVLRHFLKSSVREKRYIKGKMFPADFIPIHDNKRNIVDKKFKIAFNHIKTLHKNDKAKLLRLYRNHQRINELCSEKTLKIQSHNSFSDQLNNALNDLGKYLYNSAINLSPFVKLPSVNDDLGKHFQRFIAENGNVCCFCGINEYEEQLSKPEKGKQWRAAYDHYLPKDHYPFSAVNFNNLVPMCYQCNSKSKLAKDPCVCPINGRQYAYYPYSNGDKGELEYTSKQNVNDILNDGFWSVLLKKQNDKKKDEKQSSWNRLFRVTNRVEERVNRLYKDWLQAELASTNPNVKEIKKKFVSASKLYMTQINTMRDAYHKSILFSNLSTMDDKMIEAICNAIGKMILPTTQQDAFDELNQLGFNF